VLNEDMFVNGGIAHCILNVMLWLLYRTGNIVLSHLIEGRVTPQLVLLWWCKVLSVNQTSCALEKLLQLR
jgi:hypothetical protein